MEYGDLAFAMEPNQISEVITPKRAIFFFQLLEKIPAKKVTFAAKLFIYAAKRSCGGIDICGAWLRSGAPEEAISATANEQRNRTFIT